jgi:hypothetical protein
MSITFRVTTDEKSPVPAAQISVRQLVAFRNFARSAAIIDDDLPADEDVTRDFTFEASICPFPLAVLAKIFDFAEPAIAVIDEAQFRQRHVRFYKSDATGELMMALADTIDGTSDLDLANANAFAVLEALGLDPESCGAMPIAKLRTLLDDPSVRGRFLGDSADRYLARLDRFAAVAVHDSEPQLVWA